MDKWIKIFHTWPCNFSSMHNTKRYIFVNQRFDQKVSTFLTNVSYVEFYAFVEAVVVYVDLLVVHQSFFVRWIAKFDSNFVQRCVYHHGWFCIRKQGFGFNVQGSKFWILFVECFVDFDRGRPNNSNFRGNSPALSMRRLAPIKRCIRLQVFPIEIKSFSDKSHYNACNLWNGGNGFWTATVIAILSFDVRALDLEFISPIFFLFTSK